MRTILPTLVALAVLPSAAAAAASAPAGSLTQVAGRSGCFVDPSASVAVNGCTRAAALKSPQTVVLSPDERFAYTPSNSSHAITEFRRAPGGALSRFGCVSSETPGCRKAVNTVWAFGLAMPPDGRSLYLTTTAPTNTLDQFARNPATGAITQLPGKDACLGRDAACTQTANLNTPRGMVFSPDGRFAYVTAFTGNDVAVLARDAATSRLTPAGCVRQGAATTACPGSARNLDGATDVDISPDGRSVYVTSFRGDAITAFARDPRSGALTEAGCWAQGAKRGCEKARGLDGAYDLAISRDGRSVYVAARFSRAIATFARDGASGRLAQPAGAGGCVAQGGADGCRPTTSPSLRGVRGVAVSPDGRNVYSGAFSASALSIFKRSTATGALRQLAGRRGCITNKEPGHKPATPGCASGRGLHQVWGIAISRDGRWLYTGDGGDGNSGLAVFRRKTGG
jgi:6-phosphogluconolactonase (cycloisomerase 2 family)